MKNLAILLILFSLICSDNFAQESREFKKWQLGAIAGIQPYGKLYPYNEQKTTGGVIAGASVQYSLQGGKNGLSLLFQPHWSGFRKTYKSGNPATEFYSEMHWNVESFNFPVLVRYTVGKGIVRPFVEAGPNFRVRTELRLKENGRLCYLYGCVQGSTNQNIHPGTTQDRIGLIASVGAEVNLWKVTIPVSIRINEGIGTFETREPMQDAASYQDLKTKTFQIVTGITF